VAACGRGTRRSVRFLAHGRDGTACLGSACDRSGPAGSRWPAWSAQARVQCACGPRGGAAGGRHDSLLKGGWLDTVEGGGQGSRMTRGGRNRGERGGPGAAGNSLGGGRHYHMIVAGGGTWVTRVRAADRRDLATSGPGGPRRGAAERGGADTQDPTSSGRGRVKRGMGRTWANLEKTRSGPGPDQQ
jgi:hypothetical protein